MVGGGSLAGNFLRCGGGRLIVSIERLHNRFAAGIARNQFDALLGVVEPLLADTQQPGTALIFFHQFLKRKLAVLQYMNDLFEFAHCLLEAHPGFGSGGGF